MTRIVNRSRGFTSPYYCKETLPAFIKLAHISLKEINFTEYIAELGIEMPVALSDMIQGLPGHTKMWPGTISKS
jgi:hypothetical protein